jgi:hypothetical protein
VNGKINNRIEKNHLKNQKMAVIEIKIINAFVLVEKTLNYQKIKLYECLH